MKNCFIFLFIFSLFCFLFSQGKIDGAAAIVGDNIILHSDVLQRAHFIALEQGVDPSKSPFLFEEIMLSALNNIINQYAVLGVAEKDTNLIISNDDVDRALDQQIESFITSAGSEKLFLEAADMSMRELRSQYWKDIRDMMVIEKYQFTKIQSVDLSRVEVESFFEVYKDSISIVPENYSFSVIEAPFLAGKSSEQKAFNFLQSIKILIEDSGASFDSIARVNSHDPGTAQSGGYLGFTTRGSFVKEFEEVAFSLSPGEISGPVKTPFGYHLIRLIEKRGEKISTQHILQTINYSDEDKNFVLLSLKGLLPLLDNSFSQFDSLASAYSKKYNNYSGVYKSMPIYNIPDLFLSELHRSNLYPLLSPIIETEAGYSIICVYDHQAEVTPNLKNSWQIIYQYAKQNKQNKIFNLLVENIKKKTYIKKLYD